MLPDSSSMRGIVDKQLAIKPMLPPVAVHFKTPQLFKARSIEKVIEQLRQLLASGMYVCCAQLVTGIRPIQDGRRIV